MYIYPDNLAAKATLWLWELKDLAIIGIGFLIGIFSLVRTGALLPLALVVAYERKNPCLLCECTCLDERIEASVLDLSEFVRDCFAPSMEQQLQERMRQQFGERKSHFFLSDSHRRRWTHWRALCWRLSDRNKAALFLLTAYESLWRRMVWKCGNDGFDFQAVHLRGIKPELYSVYQAAKAIAVGNCNITLADLASPELVTDEAFHLIICALLMAKYGDVVLNLENGAVEEGN